MRVAGKSKKKEECTHPANELFAWYADDPTKPNGKDLVVTCKKCKKILKGGVTL